VVVVVCDVEDFGGGRDGDFECGLSEQAVALPGSCGSAEAIECGRGNVDNCAARVVEWIVNVLEQGYGGLGVERGWAASGSESEVVLAADIRGEYPCDLGGCWECG
jgi:hypothetical protein